MTQSKSPDEAIPAERPPLKQDGQAERLPVSASSFAVGMCGLAAFLVAIFAVRYIRHLSPYFNIAYLGLFVLIVTALGVFVPDFIWKKSYLRVNNGWLNPPSPSWPRTLTKCVGLLGSMAFVGLLYWMFPEYNASFYAPYYKMLSVLLPFWLVLSLPYIWWVDARMAKPEDGLWHMGRLIMWQWPGLDKRRIRQHLLGWLVKGFFLPLVFVYVCQYLNKFTALRFDNMNGFKSFYSFFIDLFYFIDVGICACGYLFTLRLTNTHIRSTDSTLLGWVVAILCFQPFWSLISRQYLAYETHYWWGDWLWQNPGFYAIWGTMILALMLIYALSTVAFGMRYSNLTHRGILTSGPYRWSKHPAYISQNLSWWLISVPFLVRVSFLESLRHMLLLLVVNGIYYLRAKTEERHLSHDPVYVQYAEWIQKNGLFAVLRRYFKTLTSTSPPATHG